MPSNQSNYQELRTSVNGLVDDLSLKTGWRSHIANVLDCHPSVINNALNGYRQGPREQKVLKQIEKYLAGLKKYYLKCAGVNTKM